MSFDAMSAPPVRERCHCFLARSLARKITQVYDDVLAPSGLRSTQFSLLLAVRKGGMAAPSVSALASRLHTDRTTLTRNLKILQDNGHIELVAGRDARTKRVRLTQAGEAALTQAQALWLVAQRELRVRCGDALMDQFQRLAQVMLPRLDRGQAREVAA